ncbi:discoidin domain-containing protein [Streptomyces sp. SLBN-118]|uniref:discoidin domain-containing protein n=1 Tax=Streptomyces sp. SLBN-118 TaxID=2768454 RepID=UPI0021B17422|nr:discoidin domain-containing protein [Streptomyces sp. SLBN-118]
MSTARPGPRHVGAVEASAHRRRRCRPPRLLAGKASRGSANWIGVLRPAVQAADHRDPTTRWSGRFSDAQWLQDDLGSIQPVSHVLLSWENAYGKAYQIQTSNDATNWSTIHSTSNGSGGVENITGCPARGATYGCAARPEACSGATRSTACSSSAAEPLASALPSAAAGATAAVHRGHPPQIRRHL